VTLFCRLALLGFFFLSVLPFSFLLLPSPRRALTLSL